MVMRSLRWGDVQQDWKPDGALRDVLVAGTNESEWQRVVESLRDRGWPSVYSEDGEQVAMPAHVREIFAARLVRATAWQVEPSPGIYANSFFFAADEIEFDFDPREIRSQEALDVVCQFMQLLGRTLQKPVIACMESAPDLAIMSYDPVADGFRHGPVS
jgi:hypothetical protein